MRHVLLSDPRYRSPSVRTDRILPLRVLGPVLGSGSGSSPRVSPRYGTPSRDLLTLRRYQVRTVEDDNPCDSIGLELGTEVPRVGPRPVLRSSGHVPVRLMCHVTLVVGLSSVYITNLLSSVSLPKDLRLPPEGPPPP